jgi:hypothetical protein
MNAKRRRVREADLSYFPKEVAELVRKMDRPIIVTEVEEVSILEEIIFDDLLGTQVYTSEKNTVYQIDSVTRETEEPQGTSSIPSWKVRVIGEYNPILRISRFILSADFFAIEEVRKMTKVVVA